MMLLSLLLSSVLLAPVAADPPAVAEPPPTAEPPAEAKLRRYEQGPLSAADFQAKPPPPDGSHAYSHSEIRYEMRYQFQPTRQGVLSRLTSIEVFSTFVPQKSWNRRPNDRDLLAHEQGHFDITQMHAQRLQLKFDKLLRERKPPRAVGATEQESRGGLERLVNEMLQAQHELWLEEQKEYDRLTGRGLRKKEQAEIRRVHAETLKQLRQQLSPGDGE